MGSSTALSVSLSSWQFLLVSHGRKFSRFVKTNHPTRKERLALATLFRRNEEDPHEEQEQRTHEPN
jgi:hypothetical protein